MIKAILFDWGQTLVDSAEGFRAAEKQAQARLYHDLAITDHDAFMQHYRRIRRACHDQSRLSRVEIWSEVYWYYCRDVDVGLLQAWEVDYWNTVKDRTHVFPEVITVLRDLTQEFTLALISNTQGQTTRQAHRVHAYSELMEFFDVVIIAGEKNVPPKPAAQAFELCLEKLQIAPHEAVYVGDDWKNDVCGARCVGIHPVWLKHRSVPRNYPDVISDVPVITSLNELPELVYFSQSE